MTSKSPPAADAPSASADTRPLRRFARFELRRLLGRSRETMAWLVFDPTARRDLMIVLPRKQLPDSAAVERWQQQQRKASRLVHPHLAPVVEAGEHDRWPYVAHDRQGMVTLAERMAATGEPAADIARWCMQALDGLAFAHEAGVAHRDLQLHLLAVDEAGSVCVLGLAVAAGAGAAAADADRSGRARTLSIDPDELRAHRDAAERDVLCAGLLLHHLLAAAPALNEPDIAEAADRLPPAGRDIVRLPWQLPRPVPDPLRAIANRATDRQERQRYRNARTLIRALSGWLQTDGQQGGGAHAVLIDRVRQIGALPSTPGGAARAARLALMERERTIELAQVVLHDLALSFELLRVVNTSVVGGAQVAGNGPVLTVRRAIAMIGLDGVRRCALGLRHWPGPLDEAGAHELAALIDRVRLAGRIALRLRPAGYDGEVVFLVTALQNLGRLVVQYHFPDEAAQIRKLMQPAPPAQAGEPEEPGLTEDAAGWAVLGCDIESMGVAVARHWGMDEAVLHMIRRLPMQAGVRSADGDDDILRASASAANEAVDALALPARLAAAALDKVAARYARALLITPRDLQAAVQAARSGEGSMLDDEPPPRDGPPPDPARGAGEATPHARPTAAAGRA